MSSSVNNMILWCQVPLEETKQLIAMINYLNIALIVA